MLAWRQRLISKEIQLDCEIIGHYLSKLSKDAGLAEIISRDMRPVLTDIRHFGGATLSPTVTHHLV